jgi:hypothetical protein
MTRLSRVFGSTILLLALTSTAGAQINDPYDSGGVLLPEQAAYDVQHYDLSVQVFPDSQTIQGAVTVQECLHQPREGPGLRRLAPPRTGPRMVGQPDHERQLGGHVAA